MSALDIDELIRLELQGKHEACGRYDQIIWRIRSGYVIVIYGLLTFSLGKTVSFANVTLSHVLFTAAVSVVAVRVDWTMRVRQIRVLRARDQLMDTSVDRICGEEVCVDHIKAMLHISGEDLSIPIERADYLKMIPMVMFYFITTALVFAAWLITRLSG